MSYYVQYPDLTEISVAYLRPTILYPSPKLEHYYYWNNARWGSSLESIQTEFSFGIYAPSNSKDALPILEEAGYKHLATGLNWYYSHVGQDRPLQFWWKKHEGKTEPIPCKRVSYGGPRTDPIAAYQREGNRYLYRGILAATGCGFSIQDFPMLPRKERLPIRYFTLLRAPLQISRMRQIWLKHWNFRKIDEGHMASYWLNGFDPKGYSPNVEKEYWASIASKIANRLERAVDPVELVG